MRSKRVLGKFRVNSGNVFIFIKVNVNYSVDSDLYYIFALTTLQLTKKTMIYSSRLYAQTEVDPSSQAPGFVSCVNRMTQNPWLATLKEAGQQKLILNLSYFHNTIYHLSYRRLFSLSTNLYYSFSDTPDNNTKMCYIW